MEKSREVQGKIFLFNQSGVDQPSGTQWPGHARMPSIFAARGRARSHSFSLPP